MGGENLNNVDYPTKGDYHYQDGERSQAAVGAGDRCGLWTSLRALDIAAGSRQYLLVYQ
jgi:hypothetical protein